MRTSPMNVSIARLYDCRNARGSANNSSAGASLDVSKKNRVLEGQFNLVRIQHLEHQDFMPFVLQPAQAVVKLVQVGQQIGDYDHHARAV